ncbi:MAG: nucleotidyl transferase AbiEii/AbiGii toxin family protein, partial [Candidatus Rokuibacteriota bacterium]
MTFFYEDVLLALQDGGVRFVLVGGTAVILHGVPRTTADLDIVIDLEESNVRRLIEAMTRLGFRPRAPIPAADLATPERRREWIEEKGMRAFTFQRPGRLLDEVDIIIDAPLTFAELRGEARVLEAEGLRLPVASPRH